MALLRRGRVLRARFAAGAEHEQRPHRDRSDRRLVHQPYRPQRRSLPGTRRKLDPSEDSCTSEPSPVRPWGLRKLAETGPTKEWLPTSILAGAHRHARSRRHRVRGVVTPVRRGVVLRPVRKTQSSAVLFPPAGLTSLGHCRASMSYVAGAVPIQMIDPPGSRCPQDSWGSAIEAPAWGRRLGCPP